MISYVPSILITIEVFLSILSLPIYNIFFILNIHNCFVVKYIRCTVDVNICRPSNVILLVFEAKILNKSLDADKAVYK